MVALKPLVHPFEKDRLAALGILQILDTPPEERFDRITRLASEIFDVPYAYISLIDENRQWLKSCQGELHSEMPRDATFCAHTILQNEPLIIPDTFEHPQFSQHPLVTKKPHIRFYAGHPLLAHGKHPIGSFCLSDKKPRTFETRQLQMFSDLARLVEYELHLVDKINSQKTMLKMQEELLASRKNLARELSEGARYVRSLLPAPIKHGPVQVNWVFMPSVQLGGDAFYYHWLDPDHFAFTLFDAAGHGLSAAFLSVSILDTLRSGRGSNCNLGNPSEVLSYLNSRFGMGEHGNIFFTMWYGVFELSTRKLTFACGGHPQVVMRHAHKDSEPELLGKSSFLLGAFPSAMFENQTRELQLGDQLYLFSDGLYEAKNSSGVRSTVEDLATFLKKVPAHLSAEDTYLRIKKTRDIPSFDDDVSMLVLHFQ